MSAIAGIVRFDESRPPQVLAWGLEDSLRAMTGVLAHRGPDGAGHWADEEVGVALGHLALHATPEAAHETIPLRDEEHDLVLTSDARIDNREELARELGLQVLELEAIPKAWATAS
jgi:asparagine synthase (glutamine-hydrolysing)